MALSKIQTGLVADGSVDTAQLNADAVDATILDLSDTYTFTGAVTGVVGSTYGVLYSHSIGDSNVPYNSWGTPNNTYYRWVLPTAGTYELYSEMRIRLWSVGGLLQSRLYNNTTSSVIGEIGGGTSVRMDVEDANNPNGHAFNFQISHRWIVQTTADNQDIHHQMQSNNNSSNTSVQSDSNGWNMHMWKRIG